VLRGSALLMALGVAACGGDGGDRNGSGSPDAPSTSGEPADPDATTTSTTPATDPDAPSTSTTPPPAEPEPALRRPKPNVPLSVTPPPIKPPSAPTDR
jgi:hypothetical protein